MKSLQKKIFFRRSKRQRDFSIFILICEHVQLIREASWLNLHDVAALPTWRLASSMPDRMSHNFTEASMELVIR